MSFGRYDLINWMKEYPGLKLNAEMFDEQLARMKSAEEFPPMRSDSGSAGGEGRKSEGPPDPMGSAVSKRVDLERKMAATVEERRLRMSAIENAILQIQDNLQRICLWLRYIDAEGGIPTPWKVVAMKMYKKDDESKVRTARNTHDAAIDEILQNMQKAGVTQLP